MKGHIFAVMEAFWQEAGTPGVVSTKAREKSCTQRSARFYLYFREKLTGSDCFVHRVPPAARRGLNWAKRSTRFHTQPQRLRKYHSTHSSATTIKKNGGLSHGVYFVSVATSRSRFCSLMRLSSAGNCSGATASPPLAEVNLARLAINSGRAAAFSNSKSCSNTMNLARVSPMIAPPVLAEMAME